jgi:hypothetical protein
LIKLFQRSRIAFSIEPAFGAGAPSGFVVVHHRARCSASVESSPCRGITSLSVILRSNSTRMTSFDDGLPGKPERKGSTVAFSVAGTSAVGGSTAGTSTRFGACDVGEPATRSVAAIDSVGAAVSGVNAAAGGCCPGSRRAERIEYTERTSAPSRTGSKTSTCGCRPSKSLTIVPVSRSSEPSASHCRQVEPRMRPRSLTTSVSAGSVPACENS